MIEILTLPTAVPQRAVTTFLSPLFISTVKELLKSSQVCPSCHKTKTAHFTGHRAARCLTDTETIRRPTQINTLTRTFQLHKS